MVRQPLVRVSLIVSVALWVGSLFLPALTFVFDVEPVTLPGWKVLASGWINLLVLQTSWLANLAFWTLVLLLLRPSRSARVLFWCGIALLLFSLHTVDLFLRPQFYTFREAHSGFVAWMLANLGLAACALATGWQRSRLPRTTVPAR